MDRETVERIRGARRASRVLRAGTWRAAAAVDCVLLDAADRYRRRVALSGERGTRFLLDLAAATALHDGDGLALEDGAVIAVMARAEPLVEIAAADDAALARLAWHLGNRHAEIEVGAKRLRMRRDPVLEGMLLGLGAMLTAIEAPFEPERGAYDHEHDVFADCTEDGALARGSWHV